MKAIFTMLVACLLVGCATTTGRTTHHYEGDPSAFAQLVELAYATKWVRPRSPIYLSPQGGSVVIASIVVSSGGEVLTYEILAETKSPELNQSVVNAIQNVAFIAPPPGGERRFTVMFNQEGWKVTARI